MLSDNSIQYERLRMMKTAVCSKLEKKFIEKY